MITEKTSFDAVVLHNYGNNPDGKPNMLTELELAAGAELIKQGRAKFLIMSGYQDGKRGGSDHAAVWMLTNRFRISPKSIFVTSDIPATTSSELLYAKKTAAEKGWRKLADVYLEVHHPSISVLTQRHLKSKDRSVTLLTAEKMLKNDPYYSPLLDDFHHSADYARFVRYEKYIGLAYRSPLMEKLFNTIARRYRPRVTEA
jgi:hypothetical protein